MTLALLSTNTLKAERDPGCQGRGFFFACPRRGGLAVMMGESPLRLGTCNMPKVEAYEWERTAL